MSESIDELLKNLRAKHHSTRIDAATALVETADERAIQPLIAALSDRNSNLVRSLAARALGKIGAAAIEPMLKALVACQDNVFSYPQQDLIEGLGLIGTPAIKPLFETLVDGNSWIRVMRPEHLDKWASKG